MKTVDWLRPMITLLASGPEGEPSLTVKTSVPSEIKSSTTSRVTGIVMEVFASKVTCLDVVLKSSPPIIVYQLNYEIECEIRGLQHKVIKLHVYAMYL